MVHNLIMTHVYYVMTLSSYIEGEMNLPRGYGHITLRTGARV